MTSGLQFTSTHSSASAPLRRPSRKISLGGPNVLNAASPNRTRCSRPSSGSPIASGNTRSTNGEAMSCRPSSSTTDPDAPARSRSTWASASRTKSSRIRLMTAGEIARWMTARTRGCSGGSSVRRISGRIELGSWNGRDVDEKVSQSRAAS